MRFEYKVRDHLISKYPEIRDLTIKVEKLGVDKMVIVVESPDIDVPLSIFCKEIM